MTVLGRAAEPPAGHVAGSGREGTTQRARGTKPIPPQVPLIRGVVFSPGACGRQPGTAQARGENPRRIPRTKVVTKRSWVRYNNAVKGRPVLAFS